MPSLSAIPSGVLSRRPIACAIAFALSLAASAQDSADKDAPGKLDAIHVTAAEIGRQALGTSIITASDIERRPPTNDLSDILRTMPGVNLTGNSASGQYGNNRQIDLRGMGPENTLILVDGKPVGSRDSIRMGRSGERNTRGDTNWVPAEMVDRIEVLRGPAAARYGSGASGGVINIITRRPTGAMSGSLNLYAMRPQHDEEGDGQRASVQLSGPLSDALSFRLYANHNRTDADSLDLNADYGTGATPPAGREGVKNKDANALLRWDINDDHVVELEGGTSRQGNIYAGDRAVSAAGNDLRCAVLPVAGAAPASGGNGMSALLQLRDIGVRIGRRTVLENISLEFHPGTLTALVGPNGAGKSTLLAVAAGDRVPDTGEALLAGRPLHRWKARELARKRAVLPQDHTVRFAFGVREVVAMGRLPHPPVPARDARIIDDALLTADIPHLAECDVQTLSGGESARTAFARALTQQTPLLLLDEPTAALDIAHQQRLLREVRRLVREENTCALVVLHDLNLAAHADRIVMLREGRLATAGHPREVLTADTIAQVYGQPVAILEHPTRSVPLVVIVDA